MVSDVVEVAGGEVVVLVSAPVEVEITPVEVLTRKCVSKAGKLDEEKEYIY